MSKVSDKPFKALREYYDAFVDMIPTMFFQSLSGEDTLEIVEDRLAKGEKHKLDLPKGALS